MKRIVFLLVCVLILSACVSGCKNEKPAQSTIVKEQCTVEDFTKLYSQYCAEHSIPIETSRSDMTAQENKELFKIVDITPNDVYSEIGCKIFKVNSTCETFIVYQDKLYGIGQGFGGLGVVSLCTCNFDNDSKKDLLYTYSWGSGLHRSLISIFNFTNMQEQPLDYMKPDMEMMLEKLSDNDIKVYSASIHPEETLTPPAPLDYCHVNLTRRDFLFEIVSENNNPKLINAN